MYDLSEFNDCLKSEIIKLLRHADAVFRLRLRRLLRLPPPSKSMEVIKEEQEAS
jgi:hypothetical protein